MTFPFSSSSCFLYASSFPLSAFCLPFSMHVLKVTALTRAPHAHCARFAWRGVHLTQQPHLHTFPLLFRAICYPPAIPKERERGAGKSERECRDKTIASQQTVPGLSPALLDLLRCRAWYMCMQVSASECLQSEPLHSEPRHGKRAGCGTYTT